MLIPRFWTTYMGKDITLPEITFSDGFVPLYREALRSPEFAEKIKSGKSGLCCAVADALEDEAAVDHFYSRVGIAIRGSGYLESCVRKQVGLLGYEQLGKSDMIDLRLAWAAHMVKHMGNGTLVRLNEESPC